MKKITQSFITDMLDYLNGGSCGHLMREKWINGRLLSEASKSQKLGAYFEFIFTKMMTGTGSLPKDAIEPTPELYATCKKELAAHIANELKKPTGRPFRAITEADMLAPYQLAHKNALRLKEYFDLMGIKILKAGRTLTKGKFEGTIDLICEATKKINWANGEVWEVGYQFVIDLKYVATIEDNWNPYGWGAMKREGENEQKRVHGIQARQYNFITDLPFYFMVVSSTNEVDIKFFRITITEKQSEAHIVLGNDMAAKLKFYNEIGWEPRPDISKCLECPLKDECKDVAKYPQIETIVL